jgi:protein-tyrosine-phosphatase
MQKPFTRVLFVSKSGAARALLAHACLAQLGSPTFQVFSCGEPGQVPSKPDSTTMAVLSTAGFKTNELTPKDWKEFSRSGAKPMDIIITLDATCAEQQPIWPGQPETATWDYASLDKRKDESESAHDLRVIQALHSLRRRIELLISLRNKVQHHFELRHDLRDMAHL